MKIARFYNYFLVILYNAILVAILFTSPRNIVIRLGDFLYLTFFRSHDTSLFIVVFIVMILISLLTFITSMFFYHFKVKEFIIMLTISWIGFLIFIHLLLINTGARLSF